MALVLPMIISLEGNATALVTKWQKQADALAKTKFSAYSQGGLQAMGYTRNNQAQANFIAIAADLPIIPLPEPILIRETFLIPAYPAAAAPAAVTEAYKRDLARYTSWIEGVDQLKTALLLSVGPTIRALHFAGDEVTDMTTWDIVNIIFNNYGTNTVSDLLALKTILRTPCQSHEKFSCYSAEFVTVFEEFQRNHFPINEFDKLEYLSEGTQHLPLLVQIYQLYKEEFTIADRTFLAAQNFIERRLPDYLKESVSKSLSYVDATTARNLHAASLHLIQDSMVAQVVSPEDQVKDLAKKLGLTINFGSAKTSPSTPKTFCYFHGLWNHDGKSCAHMLKNADVYKEIHLKAKKNNGLIDGAPVSTRYRDK